MSTGFDRPEAWPTTGDPGRVEAALRRWEGAAARLEAGEDRAFAEAFPDTPAGKAMLECVFGASPFLTTCLLAEPGYVRRLWTEGPDHCVSELLAGLRALPSGTGEEAAGRALRIARRRAALAIALADISGTWAVEAVTEALSRLAEAACSTALRVLLTRLAARGVLAPADPEDPEAGCGLITLGLGKLGGRELNYSSDIDLILLYEPDAVPATGTHDVERHLVRLARAFVALLSQRTGDGYAFRVDLRLRPDPSATPLVVSTASALHYYRERGRTWERAALIKARPIAGDSAAAHAFLARLAPFVWRRHLDFATVQELHDIKRQIDAQHGSGRIHPYGHDLKLGRGGIREIEFFAQTHQLVRGGRDPGLRVIPTCDVLRVLADTGRIPGRVADTFSAAYRFLRRAEHRVQMVRDEQTHRLPEDPDAFGTLARFLGYREAGAFMEELVGHLQRVERYYVELFEIPLQVTARGAPDPDAAETLAQLGRMGFTNPGTVAGILARWRSGRYPVVQAPQSRELLDALTPALLTAMLGTTDPELALARFDHLLSRLADGRQAFSLFQANLHVMEGVAEIMVGAPAVAERLAERPALFDGLLESEADPLVPDRAALEQDLALYLDPAADDEDALVRLHRWADLTDLSTRTHILFRRLDPVDEPALRRDAADCVLQALLARATGAFATRHGHIDGAASAILVMERPGALHPSLIPEQGLVLVHDAPQHAESDGETPLAASAYYEGLARRLAALGGETGREDILPAAERPDPEGHAGREVSSLDAFERRLAESTSPGERMALVRTRVAAGDPGLVERLREALRRALCAPHAAEAPASSGRASDPEGPGEGFEHGGGLVRIEHLVQSLQVRKAPANPQLLSHDTGEAIRLLEAGEVLLPEDAARLLDAWRLGVRIRAARGLVSEDAEMEDLPEALQALFAPETRIASFRDLESRVGEAADEARDALARRG